MLPAIALPEQNLKSMEEMNIIPQGQGEIVLYQPDENTHLEVRVEEDTVWLTHSVTNCIAVLEQNVLL